MEGQIVIVEFAEKIPALLDDLDKKERKREHRHRDRTDARGTPAQKKTEGRMKLTHVCELVMEVFEMTGFADILVIA